jgi:uncharacterized protein involved in exopolysaccharide biosynthesis
LPTVIQTLTEIKNEIKSKLIYIIILSMVAFAIQAYITRCTKGKYGTYTKIFPLSINKSGGSSPVDAIRAQFGISDKTDFDKIYNVKELVTSKTISRAIVESKPRNPKYKSLSAWLIDDYNNNLPFMKKKIGVDQKDSNDIHIKGSSILLASTQINNDSKTFFTTISTQSHQKELTQEMNEKIVEELSNYYIKSVTEKPRTDLYKIKVMRDSLQKELNNTERAIAGFIDANQMSSKAVTQVPQSQLLRMQKEIEALYTVTSTSYQNAKFKLLSESPIFQILDKAGPPYSFELPSWKKSATITGVICFVLLCIFFCRKIIWRIILEELSKA